MIPGISARTCFYTYLVHNRLWKQRIAIANDAGNFNDGAGLAAVFCRGVSDSIRQQFVRKLEYYGQNPIIVRSSSLLEDSFGHAFAGKYESVFCVTAAVRGSFVGWRMRSGGFTPAHG
jgi:hypothetical protein